MAATLGGMMRAPIMALMFAFEVTHDANALVPLFTACVTAYGFTVLVMPRSILTEKIARRGVDIYRKYGIDPLERHTVEEVMTHEVTTIEADTLITDALHTISVRLIPSSVPRGARRRLPRDGGPRPRQARGQRPRASP